MNQQKLYELSCKHLWLPFTQMKDYEEAPLIIERGEGVRLKDIEGKTYLDGYSSLWLNVHGHRKREIDEAIQKQLQKIAHSTLLGAANVPSILLAEKLVHITPPNLTRVFYSDSGAESVEIAIKMAYQYWQNKGFQQKTKFVTLANGYHGDTVGAISVGAIDLYHRVYRPLMFDSFVAPFPADYNNTHRTEEEIRDDALQKMQQLLAQNHEQIAAVIVESIVQGAGGMHIMPQGYLKGLAQLCKKYQVLLIVDEVATGFGRTGKLFAVEHEQVEPDLMTIAKGITGGYLPIAATMTTEEVYEAFYGDYLDMKTFFHGHSYTGNQLGCAAALANIELFEQTGLVEQVAEKAQYVATKMEKIRRLPHVGDVRQLGLICGIEIVADKETRKPFAIEQRVAYRTTLRMRELGLLTRPLGEVIVFMPPLVASYEELDEMLDIYTQAIEEVALLHGKKQVAFEK